MTISGKDLGAVNRHFRRMARLEVKYPETRFPGKPGMKPSRPGWVHFFIASGDSTTLAACGKEQTSHKFRWTREPKDVTCPRCLEAIGKAKAV